MSHVSSEMAAAAAAAIGEKVCLSVYQSRGRPRPSFALFPLFSGPLRAHVTMQGDDDDDDDDRSERGEMGEEGGAENDDEDGDDEAKVDALAAPGRERERVGSH